jgi:hypothetical protein
MTRLSNPRQRTFPWTTFPALLLLVGAFGARSVAGDEEPPNPSADPVSSLSPGFTIATGSTSAGTSLPPGRLVIAWFPGAVTRIGIAWAPGQVLQTGPTPEGPFTDVAASAPAVFEAVDGNQFFRLR